MMSEKDIARILERYLNGTATEEERRWVEKWYSTLESENNNPVLSDAEQEKFDRSDLEMIRRRISGKKHKLITFWPSLLAAAAVVIIGAFFIYNTSRLNFTSDPTAPGKAESPVATMRKIINTHDHIRVVRLEDASRVDLQPGSTLWIFADFNGHDRKVVLQGEAFFSVARDEAKPFIVFSHDVVTKVLGTSFTIKAPSKNEKVTVAVRTGLVAVSRNAEAPGSEEDQKQEVLVTPNQQVVFDPEKKVLEATLIPEPVVLDSPRATKVVYDEEPIVTILQQIEELYGVQIHYDAAVLSGCRITTAFQREGLYERLDILTKAIGATYKVEGTSIVFNSTGCETNP
jgi:ferric-dicitrate binding protein FerR (iron transport regulator)